MKSREYGPTSGYTGRIYEAEFLGEFPVTPEFKEAERKLPRDRRGHYLNDELIYDLVKKHQDIDPTNPPKELARELRIAVADSLGLSESELDLVKYYTAVHSPIDRKLGVDAFIEWTDPRLGEPVRVTFDITLSERKLQEQYGVADLIIGDLPDPDDPEEEGAYIEAVEKMAHDLAVMLQRRANEIFAKKDAAA